MMYDGLGEWFYVLVSFLFIFAVIGAASGLMRFAGWPARVTRKVVHIGVAHWWLIALAGIESLFAALVGPLVFIVLNTISYRMRLIAAMENEAGRSNLGTIYFPISLTVLVALCWGGIIPFGAGTIGVMILGWGDGLAALVGENYGRHRFRVPGGYKSVEGTLTMAAASFLVCYITLALSGIGSPGYVLRSAFLIMTAATLIEGVTPRGMDNLSVPVLSALLAATVF